MKQGNVVYLPFISNARPAADNRTKHEELDYLLLEAARLEANVGGNAYSDFLRKHQKRPDKDQASTIGRLIGGRVKADDGKLYPQLSKAERAAIQGIKKRRKEWERHFINATRLERAVNAILEIDACPKELVTKFEEVRDPIDTGKFFDAINFLERFAEELRRHEKNTRAEISG